MCQDALFQPYLPLQQLDMLKDTPSWLCGCTNSIITHQSEIDLLVHVSHSATIFNFNQRLAAELQTETGILEFRNPKLERSAGLTAADRKWMDDILTDVNESWNGQDASQPSGMQ